MSSQTSTRRERSESGGPSADPSQRISATKSHNPGSPTTQSGAPVWGGGETPPPFKFTLRQPLQIIASGESGECIARSEHASAEPQYLLRYKAADGRAVEAWWTENALTPQPEQGTCDDLAEKLARWASKPLAEAGATQYAFLSGDAQPLKLAAGDQRYVVAHASRAAPRCKNCRHAHKSIYEYCDHPAAPVTPEAGLIWLTTETARSDKGKHSICGPEGRLFSPVAGA